MSSETFFRVSTPIGFSVYATSLYWQFIVTVKHPNMAGREEQVQDALRSPHEIRQSRRDSSVYLFYHQERSYRWTCVVVKRLNSEGFVVTTYSTDAIKEGVSVWAR